MSISEKDIKILWGRAAGRCSAPYCSRDCIPFLNPKEPTVIGEMAHIIPRSKNWTRGDGENKGEDTYENLILLCPTCHSKVDKAPEGTYSRELLLKWKSDHETKIQESFNSAQYKNLTEVARIIDKMLIENYVAWESFGPESKLAAQNPYGAGAKIWALKKIALVIPNNTRIVNLLKVHKNLMVSDDWVTCVAFIQHADMFERSSYERIDSDAVPRFPAKFGDLVKRIVMQ